MSPPLDSPLTEKLARTRTETRTATGTFRGTDGSNPLPSSGESSANPISWVMVGAVPTPPNWTRRSDQALAR
jgi:hypothetical protein